MKTLLAKLLKFIGVTRLTDWLITGGWKIIEKKLIASILRKLQGSVMPRLKVKARKLGVKFSKIGNDLEDRGQLPDGSYEISEKYFMDLLDAFKEGAGSDNP